MSSPKIEYREVPGRGIGGIATQPLNAGEIVVSELPLLLYPQASAVPYVCSYCLRHLSVQGKGAFSFTLFEAGFRFIMSIFVRRTSIP